MLFPCSVSFVFTLTLDDIARRAIVLSFAKGPRKRDSFALDFCRPAVGGFFCMGFVKGILRKDI